MAVKKTIRENKSPARKQKASAGNWQAAKLPRKPAGCGKAASKTEAVSLCLRYPVLPGRPHPLGATPDAEGVNFSVFAQHATRVELLLFDKHDDREPVQVISLDPDKHRCFCFWHCYIPGLKAGAHYAYRVDGPWDPARGHRFNPKKVLLDPYSRGNTNALWNRADACTMEDNIVSSMRSVVINSADYDWEGDQSPQRPMESSVIYEMHVGGFTRSPSSKAKHPGTFRGVIEKIPYLKDLGITAVELLPVFDFDETEILGCGPDGRPRVNYWGYSTLGFFAPDAKYCVSPEIGSHLNEFRDMVKALHKAGIQVILDVVFNHSNEGNHLGPTISFTGFGNSTYYYLVPDDKQYYMDYSGCGNTLNCNHPVVRKFILDCLEFWAREMHVDGFRFDEGSILSRDENGAPMAHSPVLWSIELSETLADAKVIAEAWDAAGLYQIGCFPGLRWAEWNGRYRDTIRRFIAGTPGIVGDVATRIAGSADLYQASGRLPVNSVNFVTCHDGFTLNDLVSYNSKHNEANGEGNRDGIDDNASWNCGMEGATDDPEIEALRNRQVKNFISVLLLSVGVPMILGGDEVRRTQNGNNNAYCQDNEISWHDWSLLKRHKDVFRFFKEMIAFRQRHPALLRRGFPGDRHNARNLPEVAWHGCKIYSPGWNDPSCRVLAYTLADPGDGEDIHVILNMEDQDLDFDLPAAGRRGWHWVADTARPSPEDILPLGKEQLIPGLQVRVSRRSVVVLITR